GFIQFLKPVSANELVPAATVADVGVIPYPLTTLNHVYCCPNKLSQYMQAGLAILSTNSHYITDRLAAYDCGLTYDSFQLETLVRAVRSFLDNPQRLQTMKSNARAWVMADFNWEKQSSPYRNAIADLLGYHRLARAA